MEKAKSIARGVKAKKYSFAGVLDHIITGSIFLTFFLTPIFFLGLTSHGIGFEKMILLLFLVLLGVVAWLAKTIIKGELTLRRTPFDLILLVVFATYVVSTLFSVNIKDSLFGSYGDLTKGLIGLIIFIFFYYLVVNNINEERIKKIFWILTGSFSLLIVYSLLQLFSIFILPVNFTKSVNFTPLGTFVGLSMALLTALPFLVIALTKTKTIASGLNDKKRLILKIVLGLVLAVNLLVLAIINFYTYWPVAIVGMVIILMFFLAKIIPVENNNLVIPVVVFLFLIIFLVIGNFDLLKVELPTEISLNLQSSWGIAREAIRENPVFGSGPATYYYDFSKFKSHDYNLTPYWNLRFNGATGILFESLPTLGVVGTLGLLILLLNVLSFSFLSLVKSKDEALRSILLALFSSCSMIAVLSLLFSLNGIFTIIALCVGVFMMATSVLGQGDSYKKIKLSLKSTPQKSLILSGALLVVSIGAIILFIFGLKMMASSIYFNRCFYALDKEGKAELIERAISLYPYEAGYYTELADTFMGLANKEMQGNQNKTKIENYINSTLQYSQLALEQSQGNASTEEEIALIYENASYYKSVALDLSEEHYRKISELDPNNPMPDLRLGLIDMARANLEKDEAVISDLVNQAINNYNSALAKKGDYSAAFYSRAIAYDNLKKTNEAVNDLRNAVFFDNANIFYKYELARLLINRGLSQANIDRSPEGESTIDGLDISTNQQTEGSDSAADLQEAEQILLNILQTNPGEQNSLYMLAVLYREIGKNEEGKIVVDALIKTLSDEATIELVKEEFSSFYQ